MIINEIKKDIFYKIDEKNKILNKVLLNKRIKAEKIDISLPGRRTEYGVLHPITHTINDIKIFFQSWVSKPLIVLK